MIPNIFVLDNIADDHISEHINIDELYEKKKLKDEKNLKIFQRMLTKIHATIKATSRGRTAATFCWYRIPEIMHGYPNYDNATCIAYVIDKLKSDKLSVDYYHPNLLYIYWGNLIPSYIRDIYKEKTGMVIDELGNRVVPEEEKTPFIKETGNNLVTNGVNNGPGGEVDDNTGKKGRKKFSYNEKLLRKMSTNF